MAARVRPAAASPVSAGSRVKALARSWEAWGLIASSAAWALLRLDLVRQDGKLELLHFANAESASGIAAHGPVQIGVCCLRRDIRYREFS
jgi:hypothetical protein